MDIEILTLSYHKLIRKLIRLTSFTYLKKFLNKYCLNIFHRSKIFVITYFQNLQHHKKKKENHNENLPSSSANLESSPLLLL